MPATKEQITNLIKHLRFSKGFRSLPKDFQAIIKLKLITGSEDLIYHMTRMVKLEESGQVFDQETARLLVNQLLKKGSPKEILKYQESQEKMQNQSYVDSLLQHL